MAKSFLDFKGLTTYHNQMKAHVAEKIQVISDELTAEIARAQGQEQSILDTFNTLMGEPLTGATAASAVIFSPSNQTSIGYSNVETALAAFKPDKTLWNSGAAAEALTTGNHIRKLQGQLGDYTFAPVMTEDEYAALASTDNNTVYFLVEE